MAEGRATRVRAIAPAKVNLSLEVLGRRPDGFHEIRSEMLAIDLCDSLEVRPDRGGGVRLSLAGPVASADVPSDGSNLVCRAAHAALAEGRRLGSIASEAGVEIALVKRIPTRAGLGGGSSDAAAAWIATAAAYGLQPSDEARDRELAAIGSDCVFFAAAGATGYASCGGRGERVEPRPNPEPGIGIALLTPSVECSTAEVYRSLDPASFDGPRRGNDLEEAAVPAVVTSTRRRSRSNSATPIARSSSAI